MMTLKTIFGRATLVLVVALVLVTAIGFFVVPADAILPIHWDITGQPDGFLPRNAALLLPLAFVAVLLLLAAALVRLAPVERLQPGRHLLAALLPSLVLLFLVIASGTVLIGAGFAVEMVRLVAGGIGILLIIIGNVLPKTQPNHYAGIRLPLTLSSPLVWQKAHRAAGLACMACGVALVALVFVTANAMLLLAGLLAAVIVPIAVGLASAARLNRPF